MHCSTYKFRFELRIAICGQVAFKLRLNEPARYWYSDATPESWTAMDQLTKSDSKQDEDNPGYIYLAYI
jgi:hypothetical protein